MALRNVLIDSNGKMMICDFGLSKVMHTGKDGNVYASHVQGTAVPFQMYAKWVGVFRLFPLCLYVFGFARAHLDVLRACVCLVWRQAGPRDPRNGSLHGKNRCTCTCDCVHTLWFVFWLRCVESCDRC